MSRYAERTKLVTTALASVARKPRGTDSIECDGASARAARRRAKQIAEGDGAAAGVRAAVRAAMAAAVTVITAGVVTAATSGN